MKFVCNPKVNLTFGKKNKLDVCKIEEAISKTNLYFSEFAKSKFGEFLKHDFRNISNFIGIKAISEIQDAHSDCLIINPHPDGSPDLIEYSEDLVNYLKTKPIDSCKKSNWSDYKYGGGIELKTTCGQVKPRTPYGMLRSPYIKKYDWKAHHPETSIMLGLIWDFIDFCPTIIGTFFCNNLTISDWGKVIMPKEGGGRTTNVTILNSNGIEKMGKGWILLPNVPDISNKIKKLLKVNYD